MAKQKDHGPSVLDDAKYEALRNQGYSKEKSARIANSNNPGKKGGKSEPYEERSKEELYDKAKEIGIEGISKMNKEELISALRNH
ncbi:DUF7218 family protein [Aegicerativicinus sediminis]